MKHQSTVGAKGDLVNILLDILKAFLILFIYRELSKLYFEIVPFLLCINAGLRITSANDFY